LRIKSSDSIIEVSTGKFIIISEGINLGSPLKVSFISSSEVSAINDILPYLVRALSTLIFFPLSNQ